MKRNRKSNCEGKHKRTLDYRKTLRTTYGTQGLRIQRVKIHENSNTKAARRGSPLVVWWLGPGLSLPWPRFNPW